MRVVIAGGGTGGHLFPGIAIAQEFMNIDCSNKILFIGTKRGIESKVIPKTNFKIKYILVEGLINLSLKKKFFSMIKLPISIFQSFLYLLGFNPDLVISVGGYASGPVGLASYLLNIPLAIQEQNLKPGVTNKILGHFANIIFTSFKGTEVFFKNKNIYHTGNPVRKEITRLYESTTVKSDSKYFTILIFGGSQGAVRINNVFIEALKNLESLKSKLIIIHQTGKTDLVKIASQYNKFGFNANVTPFIENMATAYSEADLIISRSGATSIAEITASGKVAIFIPFPYAANNHQEENARNLEKAGCAKVFLEKDITGLKLAKQILEFVENRKTIVSMSKISKSIGRPYAAKEIINHCCKIINQKRMFAKYV